MTKNYFVSLGVVWTYHKTNIWTHIYLYFINMYLMYEYKNICQSQINYLRNYYGNSFVWSLFGQVANIFIIGCEMLYHICNNSIINYVPRWSYFIILMICCFQIKQLVSTVNICIWIRYILHIIQYLWNYTSVYCLNIKQFEFIKKKNIF